MAKLKWVPLDSGSVQASLFVPLVTKAVAREFVALDIETTGLNKAGDSIVEVAAIRYNHCEESEKFVSFVKPHKRIPKEVQAVHGITDEMVEDAPGIEQLMPELLAFLGDSILAGHCVGFDIGFIEVWARRCGFNPAWDYIDTMTVAKKLLPGLPNYKQRTVLEAMGHAQQTYHRAEDDCRGCSEILMLGVNSLLA